MAWKLASSTYWNTQVVSKPAGSTAAFSVALFSVMFVAGWLCTIGGPVVWNVLSLPLTDPAEPDETTSVK